MVPLGVTKYKHIDSTFSSPLIKIRFGVNKWDVAYSLNTQDVTNRIAKQITESSAIKTRNEYWV